jgi:hypothetical protein
MQDLPPKFCESHFHIDLRAPVIQQIILPPQNLLADSTAPNQAVPVASDALIANAQSLFDQIKTDLNLNQGEVNMFIADIPNAPPQNVPVMIAQANQAQPGDTTTIRTFGICSPAPNNNYSSDNGEDPIADAKFYLRQYENRTVTGPATVTILQQPTHGILRLVTQADVGTILASDGGPIDPADPGYLYLPETGYLGKDKAIILVDFGNGLKVKVVFFFQAINGPLGNTGLQDLCSKTGTMWKISSTLAPNGTSTLTSVDYLPSLVTATTPVTNAATLTSILGTSLASSLDANTSGIALNIANLPGGAVGQTTGTNITLDTNAAGYGWYIDPNPAANTDFLPTSNPNVWIAAPGSAAAGKMDMLSVLLHEYGHALGLDHSANPNDFMTPNLQPGERRLPSAAELAMMSQLAAQLNLGSTATAVASSTAPAPTSPTAPVLPIGTALSALLIGRLRRTDYGALSPVITSAQVPAPQLELAINPTLVGLNSPPATTSAGSGQASASTGLPTGWVGYGNVSANTTGTATLKNSTGADAQLAQAFNITSQDRYLEFTVSNGLQKGSGPADAFEVALDNAVARFGLAVMQGDEVESARSVFQVKGDEHGQARTH